MYISLFLVVRQISGCITIMSGKKQRSRPRRRDDLHEKGQNLLLSWREEVCNSEEVPEVEIISLLQEHIPKYRLRADSITQFGGYENQDWFIPSPALQISSDDLGLTPDQIRETLNYFLLCSNRVSQMTKTYNDIEAVTRLLEEKEKDLELTARIGKELLTANGRLEARVSSLESELRSARDLVTQLRHDLNAKTDLLQVLTDDTEEGTSPTEQEEPGAAALRKRTGALERENRALREEAARLAAGADTAEEAERQLLRDIATQLANANSDASALAAELADERQRNVDLQYSLDTTNSQLASTNKQLQQMKLDYEHTLRVLEITTENQNALAAELADIKIWEFHDDEITALEFTEQLSSIRSLRQLLESTSIGKPFLHKQVLCSRDSKERYVEVSNHLAEAQEQLRQWRKRGEPVRGLMPSVAAAAGLLPPPNNLHREMHSSIYSELSLDSGIGIGDPMANSSMQKVFETVQCASRWSNSSLAGSDTAELRRESFKPPPKPFSHDSCIDETSDSDSDDLYPGGAGVGVPGAPGASELAAALRRLTPQEIDSRRAALAASHALRRSRDTHRELSEESAVWGAGAAGGLARFRSPHKLQIVKPMEGSVTLHTWAQLAKPTLSGLLEEQEGVGVRGSRTSVGLGSRLYRLSDVEEDDDMLRLPQSSHIYTFTNSTVLHPNDGSIVGSNVSSVCSSGMSSLSSSVLGSAWSSRLTSRRSSAAVSPVLSRRDSFCAPAAPPAPPRPHHFTPTATPANSPLLGSPDSSPPPTPRPGDAAPSLHSLIASGTSILRRRHLASPASEGSPAPISMQTPGSLYMGLMHRSPMEQLTCLKRTLRSPSGAAAVVERRESVEAPLGVPAHPGSGALEGASSAGTGARRTRRPRTDLGTVGPAASPPPAPPTYSSPLGTLSTLLFGRKGGLL